MARSRKWPPQIYHHKARDEDRVVVYVGGVRTHVALGRHGSPEARAEYRRILAQVEAGGGELPPTPAAAAGLTLAELLDAYCDAAARKLAGRRGGPKQMEHITRAAAVARRLFGPEPAAAFGPRALRVVRAAMVTGSWLTEGERRRRAGRKRKIEWSRGYVNAAVGRLRRAFRWAVSEELVPAERLHALEAVEDLRKGEDGAREGRKVRPVGGDAVAATLPFLSRQAADMVRLMSLTGMRGDEVTQLRPCDLSTDGRDPLGKVWPGLWTFAPGHHKAEGDAAEVKVIFLGPQCQAILRPYLDRPPTSWCFSPREAVAARNAGRRAGRTSKVQPSQRRRRRRKPRRVPGEVYTTHALSVAVKRAAQKAGVEHWSPHRLRHAVGTAVRAQYTLDHARAALGQESVEAALIYAERDLDKAAEVARRMG